jgi:hypothetical protein
MRRMVLCGLLVLTPACKSDQTRDPSRQLWVDAMRRSLPSAFCGNDTFFRSCFQVDAAGCQTRIRDEMDRCLREQPELVPDHINVETGREAGQSLGACVGTGYQTKLAADGKFVDTPVCNDPTHWVPS